MKIFAYGSNMYSKRLNNRIKSAKFVAKGFVKQHKIAFHKTSKDGSGKADCHFSGSDQDKTWGVIFEIDDYEKPILDKYEGIGNGYNEKTVTVVCGDKSYKAQIYIADDKNTDSYLKPYDWYLEYLIKGAEEFCLPLSYIENVLKKVAVINDSDTERRKKEYEILDIPNNDTLEMGGFTILQWKSIREKITGSTNYSLDWDQAIKWFKERINRRYLVPLNDIASRIDGTGFTITSILCVMIEHLAAVREGKIHSNLKREERPKYEYKYSGDFYKKFLGQAEIFKGYFHTEDSSSPPFCVDDFYKNVRCSLLHEACIKNNWRINVSNCCLNPEKALFRKNSDNIKRIFRDIFQEKIIAYIDSYIEELKEKHELRMNFARKMDSLCELAPDPINYEWWIDK